MNYSTLSRPKTALDPDSKQAKSLENLREKTLLKFQQQQQKHLENTIKLQRAEALDYLKRKRIEEKVYLDKRRVQLRSQIQQRKMKGVMDCNAHGIHNGIIKWWRSWDMLLDPRQWSIDGSHMSFNKCFKCRRIRDKTILEINHLDEEYSKVIMLLQDIRLMNE